MAFISDWLAESKLAALTLQGEKGPPSVPQSRDYGATVYALHCAASVDWAGRVSNPPPSRCKPDALPLTQPPAPRPNPAARNAPRGQLGVDELRWPNAVRPGDALHVETEIVDLRVSRSKPSHGVVRLRNVTVNQRGEIVQTMSASALVLRRSDTITQ